MRRQRGFTLIELMIVVVVIGILAAIGYPSYTEYAIRANRTAAQSFMMELASKQERYILDKRIYTGTVGDLLAIPEAVSRNYNVDIPAPTAINYTIRATPIPGGRQASKDVKCGTLTLDQAGTKTVSGTGSVAECWKG